MNIQARPHARTSTRCESPVNGRTAAVASLLLFGWTAAASQPHSLSEAEATRILGTASIVSENAAANFPKAFSTSPVLINSNGPAPVNQRCFDAWRRTFEQLTAQGYLSEFHEIDDRLGVNAGHLTATGKRYFRSVIPGSIYWLVRVAPVGSARDVTVTEIRREKRKKAVVDFRFAVSEPFHLMWSNRLFDGECRGEMGEGVVMEKGSLAGHAHFRYRRGAWEVSDVILAAHDKDE